MGRLLQLAAAPLLSAILLPLGGCGCGFDCNSDDEDNGGPASLTLGLSDAMPEEAEEVVVSISRVELRRDDGEDVVIDAFTIDELDLENTGAFQVNLLDYRGSAQLEIITDLELDAGAYSELFIAIDDEEGVNDSFVLERDGDMKDIVLSGEGITLGGFELSGGEQAYTIEFELAQSLQYRAEPDNYLLTTDGMRLVNSLTSAEISGTVDRDLFDTDPLCDAKDDPEVGNRVYLYAGADPGVNRLADVFNDRSSTAVPGDAIAPFAVATVLENPVRGTWEYAFGFLPAGDYTLAFACDTGEDDPVDYDGSDVAIPLPADQVYEINLGSREEATCNLGEDVSC